MALNGRVEWLALQQQKNTLEQCMQECDQILRNLDIIAQRYDTRLGTTHVGGQIRTWRGHLETCRSEAYTRCTEMITFIDERLKESQTAFGITQDEIAQITNNTTISW
ncbi:MAG: hypothetical protein FWC79_03250 [Oscillospiraceae bacterium]|nr:hypothetical protein [Oscillospiraceae bacterium]